MLPAGYISSKLNLIQQDLIIALVAAHLTCSKILRTITSSPQAMVPLHGIVGIPIILPVSFVLSYYTVGLYATLVAFGAVFLFIPLQFFIGKRVQVCRFGKALCV